MPVFILVGKVALLICIKSALITTLPARTINKTSLNKFAISNHKALILGMHALRSYLKLICEYELHSLSNKKVSGAKDHGKNHIKVGPPLVCHL